MNNNDHQWDIETELIDLESTEGLPEQEKGMLVIGSVLMGLYRIEGFLGKGGMGRVYLARNLKLDNLWAIKYIPHSRSKGLLTAEEDILRRLNHVYLPQIADVFHDNTGTYIVESYIKGITLEEKIQEEGLFDEATILEWVLQLTEVLSYLHNIKPKPIIYKDMKPSNVMITVNNKAVLIDFGISSEVKESLGPIAATSKFAAPEQLKGYWDERTDIYSLGLLIYYLFTKRILNINLGPENLMEVSKKMQSIIKKSTSIDPIARYQSMEELREDLIKCKTGNRLWPYRGQEYIAYGASTIAFLGVKPGVGTTHSAILMANHLAVKYKVAVIEMNNSNTFKEISEITSSKTIGEEYFSFNRVDYYFSLSLPRFFTHYRRKYDFILLDFGAFEDIYDIDEFIRSDMQVVIGHGVDWKIREIVSFYRATKSYDPNKQWKYIIPFLSKGDLKDLQSLIENKTYPIPLNTNPFVPSRETEEIFNTILGIKADSNRKLFKNLLKKGR